MPQRLTADRSRRIDGDEQISRSHVRHHGRLSKGLLGVCAGLALLLGAGAGAAIPNEIYEHPGKVVRLPDGRRINLRCSGRGAPTVLLESGFGANSGAWAQVQPLVAETTRVCAYDRAGYGFSDPGPLPRDGVAIARDLDRALTAARVAGPYIIVGHSAGGLYGRLFAGRRLGEVVGLVFVDSSLPYQDRRMAAIYGPGAGSVEGIAKRVQRCLDAATAPRGRTIAAELDDCLPKSGGAHARLVALRPDSWRTQLSEIDTLFDATSEEVVRMGDLLKDKPAIVLTAQSVEAGPNEVWQAMHRELAASFLHGEQRAVKSSHLMMNDRPEVVAGAVLELVEASRKPVTAKTALP
jgi:pimeloyl-ACP methyl ester carboxylesterase